MFTKVLAFIGTFTTLTVTFTALAGSSSLTLLTSLVAPHGVENKLCFPWRLPIAVFHFVTNGFHLFAYWLQWTSIVSYSRDVSCMLQSIQPRETDQVRQNFMLCSEFMRTYRVLGVLDKQFSNLYEHYMSQIQTAAVFCVVLNMYQAVVGGSVRSLVIAIGVALGFIQFLEATAEVHHTSTDLLEEWKRVSRRKVPLWFPRSLKSCRHLHVPVGSFFYVDRGLVLTVLSIMLNTSASVIITH